MLERPYPLIINDAVFRGHIQNIVPPLTIIKIDLFYLLFSSDPKIKTLATLFPADRRRELFTSIHLSWSTLPLIYHKILLRIPCNLIFRLKAHHRELYSTEINN